MVGMLLGSLFGGPISDWYSKHSPVAFWTLHVLPHHVWPLILQVREASRAAGVPVRAHRVRPHARRPSSAACLPHRPLLDRHVHLLHQRQLLQSGWETQTRHRKKLKSEVYKKKNEILGHWGTFPSKEFSRLKVIYTSPDQTVVGVFDLQNWITSLLCPNVTKFPQWIIKMLSWL